MRAPPAHHRQCSHTKNIPLFNFTLIDLGVAYFNVNVVAPITTTANINGDGVTSHRTMTVSSTDALAAGRPEFHVLAAGEGRGHEPVVLVAGGPAGELRDGRGVEPRQRHGQRRRRASASQGPCFSEHPPLHGRRHPRRRPIHASGLFTLPTVTFNTINLTAPAQNVDLGNLLPNLTAPTVVMDTIPTNGTEGNPIALSVEGNGPGRQPQPVR